MEDIELEIDINKMTETMAGLLMLRDILINRIKKEEEGKKCNLEYKSSVEVIISSYLKELSKK